MTIFAIEGYAPSAIAQSMATSAPQPSTSFGAMLLEGAMRTDTSQQQAGKAMADFAVGGATPPHQVMLTLEDARMSLELALQVRARLVEGYQELMRMQL
ncbi:flagellar hook-basal body complex protein FliE [Dyella sp.]|uniref:flagellar hook-basal body complex protein FliE n=1 Tax=Dyella sp. TaxID=1869338 RepID=UPI002FD915DD